MKKLNDYCFEIPPVEGMKVPARIFISEKLLKKIEKDGSIEQIKNVAKLPGIISHAIAMPDIHSGYGFPIGGVAAFELKNGIISPGGVGYDINCGVRACCTNLTKNEIRDKIKAIIDNIYKSVPSGVGSQGKLKLSKKELEKVFLNGANWAVSQGFGNQEDTNFIEEKGCISDANPDNISKKAYERGAAQLGTLGSGNHFIEIGFVEKIFNEKIANIFGLFPDQIIVFIHTGSRGFGHQVCEDSIKLMINASQKYGINLPDRQLCCAPFYSEEGKFYYGAMNCAINFAFANRQIISHWVKEALLKALDISPNSLGFKVLYEVAHNIAKKEKHTINGTEKKVIVHRKGATRAFPAKHPSIPYQYKDAGQPVLIPGDMGRYSFILVGTQDAMKMSFGSSCHGAGRMMSRHQAKKSARGRNIYEEMENKGIYLRAPGMRTVLEEISEAYKDVSDVVEAVEGAGIAKIVAKTVPLGVIKG